MDLGDWKTRRFNLVNKIIRGQNADTSLRSRLQRLFSTNVIVRNVVVKN